MIEICRLIEALRKYNKSYRGLKEGHTGFGMRTKDEELLEVGYGNYAEVMLPLLASTDLGEESFAVGVTGPWGSGKTTFLQSMKAKMGENFMVVEFTPWYSDTAESLVRDFFMCLDSKLGSMNVKADFSRYLAVLQDYDTSGTLRILNKLATFRTTIEDEKRKIEERLALIRRKVVIMIDDTDRMGKEELMELLKLIRLTANFKNVIFMVAYDKEYVLRRMKDSEIENGTEYLKKIFPLEITLPYVENSVLPQLFVQEMNRCGFEKAFVDETEKQLREKNVHGNPLLFQYVKTFRDIKNFVNSLLVGYKLIESSSVKGEYSYKDFFWMEVIHTYLPDIYDKLLNDRRLLLNIDSKNTNGGQMLVYRALPDDKDNQNDNTKRILLILFGEDNKDDKSIRRLNNYYKYFTYRLPTNVISNAEFLDFLRLNKEEDRRANINKYSEEQKIESFFYHFAEFNLGKCEEKQQVQNFMWVVIEMAEYSSPYISMETLFKSSMAANSLKLIDASYVYRLIEEHLKEKDFDSFDAWNRLLASIFSYAISVDGKKLEKYRSILSDTQIEELANLNCDNYLEYIGPQLPDISEVWIEDSDIKAFVKGAYVNLYGEPYKWSDNSKNLVFNSLVKHYSAQKEKNDRKHFIAPYEEAKHMGLEPKAMERLKKEIKTLFGSDEKLEEFIDKCFVKPDEEGKK